MEKQKAGFKSYEILTVKIKGEMKDSELIEIIREHSLTVRCLPFEVVEKWTYREGDKIKEGEELVYWKPDIDYFKKTTPRLKGAKIRMDLFYERFPKGRPFVQRTRTVDKGGWWYVKETKNTGSAVRFNREYDKFFAPTLKGAIELFIKETAKQNK